MDKVGDLNATSETYEPFEFGYKFMRFDPIARKLNKIKLDPRYMTFTASVDEFDNVSDKLVKGSRKTIKSMKCK